MQQTVHANYTSSSIPFTCWFSSSSYHLPSWDLLTSAFAVNSGLWHRQENRCAADLGKYMVFKFLLLAGGLLIYNKINAGGIVVWNFWVKHHVNIWVNCHVSIGKHSGGNKYLPYSCYIFVLPNLMNLPPLVYTKTFNFAIMLTRRSAVINGECPFWGIQGGQHQQ